MSRSSLCLLALVLGLLVVGGSPAQGRLAANDPVFTQGLQWGLERIGAPDAWSRGTGAGVTIAVVDSGVDLRHQDLRGKIRGSVSCIGANEDPDKCTGSAQDDNGHGTHVAGIALATTDNGLGIAGVAPDADLLAVRVLANDCTGSDCTASGTAGDVSAGIRWAVDHGADVINLSLGGGSPMQSALGCSFCDAVDYAWSKGVIAVVASGNDATNDDPVLPEGFADEPAVIVTATTRGDTRASYSNSSSGAVRAARWPVAAPGGEAETQSSDCATGGTPKGILSTYWSVGQSDQYACLAGTSMAAPHVAGALAVLLSTGLAPQAAVDRLLATATDLGAKGRDDSFGYGRIDLAKAVGPSAAPTTTTDTTAASSTTGVDSSTTTAATAATSSSSVAPPTDTRQPPKVSTPETSTAAPFSAVDRAGGPPALLVAAAVATLLASAAGTAATAWRRLRAGATARW